MRFYVMKIKYIMHNVKYFSVLVITLLFALYNLRCVASFSGLPIFDCLIGILLRLFARLYGKFDMLKALVWPQERRVAPISLPVYWRSYIEPGEWAIMYFTVNGIDFTSFYNFSIGFWECSDGVFFPVYHPTHKYL
jgi:hypothetical protein